MDSTAKCDFFEISWVDASGIKSQWQAHFTQVFPLNMSELPVTDPSDKEFFEKHWKGDNHTTYEQFMKENYGKI